MAKKLKSADMRLMVNGVGVISNENITPQLYEVIIKINPSLAEYFEDYVEPTANEKKIRGNA
jgi:hypothetical protein